MRDFFVKVIFPLAAIGLLLLLFWPVCKINGEIDYFLLWILVGCPFGIQRMFVWMIPKGHDIGGTVGIVAMNFIIGGLIGGFVAVYRVIYAAFYILKSLMGLVMKRA